MTTNPSSHQNYSKLHPCKIVPTWLFIQVCTIDLKTREIDFSEFSKRTTFLEQFSSIPDIVDAYLTNKMHEAIKTTIQLQSERLRLKIDTITPELLAGPTFGLMKGTCKSLVELEYFFEEVYKATTDQLDWHKPEGQQYSHDLRKPLPLIPNFHSHQVIPFDHFINNDLAYLFGGVSSRTYATFVTKTKAADYGHIKWIEDLVPNTIWSKVLVNYDKHALWGIHIGDKNVNNSMDLLLTRNLLVMYTPNIESLLSQSFKLSNGTATNIWIGSSFNKEKKNKLMRIDELHKISDGTLDDVRTALNDHLKGIRMEYLQRQLETGAIGN
ncbi:hypothetical protein Tco_0482029 [Tanacetum coccineum]